MASRLPCWRVEKAMFIPSARAGEGARIAGGRWNSPGLPAIYAAESLALAVLEILVHAVTPEERADPRVWFRISLPAAKCPTVAVKRLPIGWDAPTGHPRTVEIGDAWLRGGTSVALRVPSAVIPGAWNVILNPAHPEFAKAVRWTDPLPLALDPRLMTGAAGERAGRWL
jgi:RES domain-containing protein